MNAGALLDRLAAERHDAPAIATEGGWRGWGELRDRVCRLVGGFRDLGVGPGDRVAVLAANEPRYLETYLALARLGALVVPLNIRLSPAELDFQLRDAEAALWLVGPSLLGLADEAAPALRRIVMAGPPDGARDGILYEDLLASARPVTEVVPVGADDVLGIFYTGGTTGLPKGVMLTHAGMLANAANMAPALGYRPGDVHLHAAPMFHLADLGTMWTALLAGVAHAFLPQWSPEGLLAAVERHRVTATLLAPVMVTAVVRCEDIARHDLGSWRLLHYGGSPITEDTLYRALRLLPCGLFQGYGQTEATQSICIMTPEEHRSASSRPERLRSCGRFVPGVKARVADADHRALRPGETGEVIVRGPTVMKGYWKRPAETAAALRDGWLHTGDLATVDDEGFVYILDRKKDMIISGGENVYSVEVENALASHPAVLEAAVIGVPDDTWGERVHAVVVLAPGRAATPEELQQHCRTLIGGYKIPRSVEFRDALPRTPAGKIQKARLREPHWRGERRGVH